MSNVDPMVLAGWGTGGIGGAMQVHGILEEGKYQEALHKQRARFAVSEGDAKRAAEKQKAKRVREQGREIAAGQSAHAGKNNIVGTTGSFLLVQTDTAAEIEEEARIISREGDYAYSRGVAQAGFERFQGKQARRAAKWKAGTTIMTNAQRNATLAMG